MSSISAHGPNVVSLEPWNAYFFIMNMFMHDPCIHDFAVTKGTRGIREVAAVAAGLRTRSVLEQTGGNKDGLCKFKNLMQKDSITCTDIYDDENLKDLMENNDVSEIIENIQDIDCESDVVRVASKVLSNIDDDIFKIPIKSMIATEISSVKEAIKGGEWGEGVPDFAGEEWEWNITNGQLQSILLECKTNYNPLYNEYDILLILTEIAYEARGTMSAAKGSEFLQGTIDEAQLAYESAQAGGGVGHPGGDYANGQRGGAQEAVVWLKDDADLHRGKGSQWQAAVFKNSLLYFKMIDSVKYQSTNQSTDILKRGEKGLGEWKDQVYQCVWNILPNSYNRPDPPPPSFVEFKNEYFDQLTKALIYFNPGATFIQQNPKKGEEYWEVKITTQHLSDALEKIKVILTKRVTELTGVVINPTWCLNNPPVVGDDNDDNYTIFKAGTKKKDGKFRDQYQKYFYENLGNAASHPPINGGWGDPDKMRNTFADIINAKVIGDGLRDICGNTLTYNDVLFLMNEYLNIITIYNYIKEPLPKDIKSEYIYAFKFKKGVKEVKSATGSLGPHPPKSSIAGRPRRKVDPKEYMYFLDISLTTDTLDDDMELVDSKLQEYEKIILDYIKALFDYENDVAGSWSIAPREKDMIEFSLNCVSAIVDNLANSQYRHSHRHRSPPTPHQSQLNKPFWTFYGQQAGVLGWKVNNKSRGSDSTLMDKFKTLLIPPHTDDSVLVMKGVGIDEAQAILLKNMMKLPDETKDTLKKDITGDTRHNTAAAAGGVAAMRTKSDQSIIYINNASSNSIIQNSGVNDIQGTFNIASVIDSQTAFPRFTNNPFCRKNSEFKNMDITIISNDYDGQQGLFYRVRVTVTGYLPSGTGDIQAKIEAYLKIEGEELIYLEDGQDPLSSPPIIIDTANENPLEAAASLVRLVQTVLSLFNDDAHRDHFKIPITNPSGRVDTKEVYKYLQKITSDLDSHAPTIPANKCKRLIMESAFRKGLGDFLQEILAWAPNRGYVEGVTWPAPGDGKWPYAGGYRMSPGVVPIPYNPLTPNLTVLQLNGDQPSAMRVMFFNNLRKNFFNQAAGEDGLEFWTTAGDVVLADTNLDTYFYNSVGGYFTLKKTISKKKILFDGINQYVVQWKVNYATISCIYKESTGQVAGGEAVAVDGKKRKTRKTRKTRKKRRVKYSTIRRKSKKTRRSRRKRRKRRRHTTRN
jgi:hypothetical protein